MHVHVYINYMRNYLLRLTVMYFLYLKGPRLIRGFSGLRFSENLKFLILWC